MSRVLWAGIAAAVILAVLLVLLFVVPFPESHTAQISLPAPAAVSTTCGEALQSEGFPSWFVGTAAVRWTAVGGSAGLWINQTGPDSAPATNLYNATGLSGSGSVSIEKAAEYHFVARNCGLETVYVNLTLTIDYSATIL